MRAVVYRDQVCQRHTRILLSGREARVAQQFLDRAEIGAVGQQVRREGVPEAVRMNRGVARQISGVKLDDEADALGSKPPAEVKPDR